MVGDVIIFAEVASLRIAIEQHLFPLNYFPEFWHCLADSHGQGVKVIFPMKVRAFISWSPKQDKVRKGHNLLPTAFQEKLSFTFIKTPFIPQDKMANQV